MGNVESGKASEVEGTVSKYVYKDKKEATESYASLTDRQKAGMAKVYQEAFAGYPWYEVFKCISCEEFSKTNDSCVRCGGNVFSDAYPTKELIGEYFPHMMLGYTPGVTIILEQADGVIGFTTGGATSLAQLIQDKYKGNSEILSSIVEQTGVLPEEMVFYENETCISTSLQQKGAGGKLNYARVKSASEMNYPLICGRTINEPWLRLKERQLAEFGYDFIAFNPAGDTYEVDGVKRQFFMATRNRHEE